MKRILAVIGIVLLGGMIIATLICAIAGAPSNVTFVLLLCDLAVPVMIWVFLWFTRLISKKDTPSDTEKKDPEA